MKYKIVTIEREYGSGGREIGSKTAEKLGIKCYGEEILTLAARESGVPERHLEAFEESSNDTVWDKISQFNKMIFEDGNAMSDKDRLAKLEAKIILKLAERESCVFVGRGSGFLLGDRKDTLSVFIYADYEFRKNHAINNYGIDETEADKKLKSIDKKRANYYNSYRELMWGEKEGYSLMLNSGVLGIDKCVDIIVDAFKK